MDLNCQIKSKNSKVKRLQAICIDKECKLNRNLCVGCIQSHFHQQLNQQVEAHQMIDLHYLTELLKQETNQRIRMFKKDREQILREYGQYREKIIEQLDSIQMQIEIQLNQIEAQDKVIPIYQQLISNQLNLDKIQEIGLQLSELLYEEKDNQNSEKELFKFIDSKTISETDQYKTIEHLIIKLQSVQQILVNQNINQKFQNQIEFLLNQQAKNENKLLLTVFASNEMNYEIQSWDMITQKLSRIYQPYDYQIQFSQSSTKTILQVKLRDFEFSKQLSSHTNEVWPIAISEDNKYLASGSQGKGEVFLWDLETHNLARKFKGPEYAFHLSFSKDNKKLAAAGKNSFSIFIFNLISMNNNPILLEGHSDNVLRTVFFNDSTYLISGSRDNSLKLWNVKKGKEISQVLVNSVISGVAVSSSNQQIAFCDTLGLAQLYDSTKLISIVRQVQWQAHLKRSNYIEFISNSQCLLTSGVSEIRFWKISDLLSNVIQCYKEIPSGGTNQIWTVKAFPNSAPNQIIACDGSIKIWNFQSGEMQQNFEVQDGFSSDCVAYQFDISRDFNNIFVGGKNNQIKVYQRK